MKQAFVHWRFLPVALLLAFLPAMTAHGQYENQYQRQQVSDYTDTRTQGYMQTVIELSSTLGSAHAIRQLCNGSNDQYWRGYMQRLLSMEAPYQSRMRSSMVDAFNNAFASENSRRQRCDESAVSAEKVYASTGQRLADDLAAANLPEKPRQEDNTGQ
ncbi:TIGR02301 family protein [Henriciella sp.]|uniref:TIGR02301 family protein n=1 Tax=Henriciella sp. TaxID=1968823 RepID=UPI002621E349|nr:TIGR02301 family protein [Henriciella sp.]